MLAVDDTEHVETFDFIVSTVSAAICAFVTDPTHDATPHSEPVDAIDLNPTLATHELELR